MKWYGTKKYELTDRVIEDTDSSGRPVVVHRIRSLRNFRIEKWARGKKVISEVRIGDLGGWIEKEENLSHSGTSWVDDCAIVFGDAVVSDDAWVGGHSLVFGHAKVCGKAKVRDSRLRDCVEVRDYAVIDKTLKNLRGSTLIFGSMHIISGDSPDPAPTSVAST